MHRAPAQFNTRSIPTLSTKGAVMNGPANPPTEYIEAAKIDRAGLSPVLCRMAGIQRMMKWMTSILDRFIDQSSNVVGASPFRNSATTGFCRLSSRRSAVAFGSSMSSGAVAMGSTPPRRRSPANQRHAQVDLPAMPQTTVPSGRPH
jgi:hypothetical protein